MTQQIYILPLRQVGLSDIGIAGGKNASLGEMINNLDDLGIRIPDGFVITVHAYRAFIESSGLEKEIRRLVQAIDFDQVESLRRAGLQVRQLIRNSKFPSELSAAIIEAYHKLSKQYDQTDTDVAVRSARALGLEVAGVDLIRSRRGPLVLEVNSTPGLEGVESVCGVDVAGAIIASLERARPPRRPASP